jgi:hypothetical protein
MQERKQKRLAMILVILFTATIIHPIFTITSERAAEWTTVVTESGGPWYVALNGSDSYDGLYPDHRLGGSHGPFLTIKKAVASTSYGDTIYIRRGDYTAPGWESGNYLLITKSGITLRNYTGEKVVIDGKSVTIPGNEGMIQLYTGSAFASNVLFYGLNFSNSSTLGVKMWCSPGVGSNDNITFSHCEFYNIPKHTILGYNPDYAPTKYIQYFNMNNCTVSKVGFESGFMGECISLGGFKNFIYEHNVLRDFTKQGLHNGAGTCNGIIQDNTFNNENLVSYKIDPAYGINDNTVHDIIVRNNLFTGNGQTAGTGAITIMPEVGEGHFCRVYNIYFYNNIFNLSTTSYESYGFKISCYSVKSLIENVYLTYNTFYIRSGISGSYPVYIVKGDDTIRGCVVANNLLITGGLGNQIYFSDLTKIQTNVTLKNNAYYYKGGTTLGIRYSGDSSEFETGSVVGDPYVVSFGHDFHLNSTSPCIDAASSSYNVSTDYDGIARHPPYDIGAFEYMATTYYVSNDGSDSNSGTSEESPWQTVLKVSNEMKPAGIISGGAIVKFKRGDVFADSYIRYLKNGTDRGHPTVLDAYGVGINPVFTGQPYGAIWLTKDVWRTNSVNNITIRNLRFENNSGNHVRFSSNSSNIIVENCFFGNRTGTIGMGMLRFSNNCHDSIIRNNTFVWYKTDAYEDGLSICGSYNILVENNTFSGITHTCVMVYGYWCLDVGYITDYIPYHAYDYVIIRNNTFNTARRATEPGYFADHTLIENNKINIWPYCNDPTNSSYQILGGSEQIFGADNTIERFNTYRGVRDSRAFSPYGEHVTPLENTAIYHNTIYSTDRINVPADYRYPGSSGYTNQGVISASIGSTNTYGIYNFSIFNNILYLPHPDNSIIARWYDAAVGTGFTNCEFKNNLFLIGDSVADQYLRFNSTNQDITYCEANSPVGNVEFSGNVAGDPEIDTNTLELNSTSDGIDAGKQLAKTTASGTNSYIPVDRAFHFWPHGTIRHLTIAGDIIFVGNDQHLEVLEVIGNTLRVNRSITYVSGEDVGLQKFYSSTPDIGAYEFAETSTGSYLIFPKNDTVGICRQPKIRMWINGTAIKTNWYSSPNDITYTRVQKNTTSGNNILQWNYTGAASRGQAYFWKVTIDNGTSNVTKKYFFSTKSTAISGSINGKFSSLEWDTSNGQYPTTIRLGNSSYYLVAARGNSNYLRLYSLQVNSGTGAIQLIDVSIGDSTISYYPSLTHISGDVYAVAFEHDGDASQIRTFKAYSSNGTISDNAIDTMNLPFGFDQRIVNVAGNIYCVSTVNATGGGAERGTLYTIYIWPNGSIKNQKNDTVVFDSASASFPELITIDSNTVAVIYNSSNGAGVLKTYNISSTGDITNAAADSWAFTAGLSYKNPDIYHIVGNIYAVSYYSGGIKTVNITTNGKITKSWIGDSSLDDTYIRYPNINHVSGNIYAIAYQEGASDGTIKTINITNAGAIGSSTISTYVFGYGACVYPVITPGAGNKFLITYVGFDNDGWAASVEIRTNGSTVLMENFNIEGYSDESGHELHSMDDLNFSATITDATEIYINILTPRGATINQSIIQNHSLVAGSYWCNRNFSNGRNNMQSGYGWPSTSCGNGTYYVYLFAKNGNSALKSSTDFFIICPTSDTNMDRITNFMDLTSITGSHWGEEGSNRFISMDANGDGRINFNDLTFITGPKNWGWLNTA